MTNNPFSLKDKTILVTGASSGIGKAIAIECSKMGARVIIVGRNTERLNETLSLVEGNKDHLSFAIDLNIEDNVTELIANIPKLDGIVLAAGIVEMLPVLFATPEKFKKIYETNLFSPIELLRLIVKKKKYNSGLSIVAIDSVAGTLGFSPANGIYGSGKAALMSFMKYCALELAPKNIRVNTISPGMILTPMHTKGVVESEKLEEKVSHVPIKVWGKPEDIAYASIYLLSNAASYVTGANIVIDGGITI